MPICRIRLEIDVDIRVPNVTVIRVIYPVAIRPQLVIKNLVVCFDNSLGISICNRLRAGGLGGYVHG